MNISSSLHALDFAVIILYIIAVLAIGFWVSYKNRKSEDLFLADRSLGWFNVGLSIFGTNISPSMMIASAAIAYSTGMVGSMSEWLAWWFMLLLAMIFIPHYLNTGISTMPQFMVRRFDERCRVVLSWFTIVAIMILWLGGTLYAGGLLLGQILNWPFWLSSFFLIVIATSFTVAGGLAAVVITDSFQSILMIVSSIILTLIMLVKVGGVSALAEKVPADHWQLFRPVTDETYPWPAFLLGYSVSGIWFWCTDQTIVQRVLGARNIRQGQAGVVFAAALKIITPLIFIIPGIICRVLHPDLPKADDAYALMISQYLPVGMVGLIVAVLIAALISTIDSGLNSLSTVFTLDICAKYAHISDPHRLKRIGRIVTVAGAFAAIAFALGIKSLKSENMYILLGTIISFLAPPLAAVFSVGVLWKRANAFAAFWTLIVGGAACIVIGLAHMNNYPSEEFWPHFFYVSTAIFVILVLVMIVLSLMTSPPPAEKQLPSIIEGYKKLNISEKPIWITWGIIFVIMMVIYIFFQRLSMK